MCVYDLRCFCKDDKTSPLLSGQTEAGNAPRLRTSCDMASRLPCTMLTRARTVSTSSWCRRTGRSGRGRPSSCILRSMARNSSYSLRAFSAVTAAALTTLLRVSRAAAVRRTFSRATPISSSTASHCRMRTLYSTQQRAADASTASRLRALGGPAGPASAAAAMVIHSRDEKKSNNVIGGDDGFLKLIWPQKGDDLQYRSATNIPCRTVAAQVH